MEFKNIDERLCRVDIQINTASQPSIIVLVGGTNDQPVLFQKPETSNHDDRVNGGGITINAIYTGTTISELRSLYTIDPHGKRIIYSEDLDNSGTFGSSDVVWCGYLATEVYKEDYSISENIPIQLEGNDGLSTLDRYLYLDDNDNYILDDEQITTVLSRIFTKIGLNDYYTRFFVATNLQIENQNVAYSVLQYIKVQNKNYYDEQGTPMTYYQVLNEICKALHLNCFVEFVRQANNNYKALCLVDYNCLGDVQELPVVYKYSTLSGAFGEKITDFWTIRELNNTDLKLRYNQTLNYKPGYSQFKFTYEGHSFPDFFTKHDWNKPENWVEPNEFTVWNFTETGVEGQDGYYYASNWQGVSGITRYNTTSGITTSWLGTRYQNDDKFQLKWFHQRDPSNGGGSVVCQTDYSEYVCRGVNDKYLKVTGQFKFIARDGYFDNEVVSEEYSGIGHAVVLGKISIGNMFYNLSTNTWTADSSKRFYMSKNDFINNKTANFENQWVELKTYLPIHSGLTGNIKIEIHDSVYAVYEASVEAVFPTYAMSAHNIRHIFMKDLRVQAVENIEDDPQDSDILLEADFQNDYRNTMDISISHGDSSQNCVTHLGAFVDYTTDLLATNFNLGNTSDLLNLNDIIRKKYAAEFQDTKIQMNVTVTANNINFGSTGTFNKLSPITIPDFQYKSFCIESGQYNAKLKEMEMTITEILQEDEITLV
jgi:hypothetical protein